MVSSTVELVPNPNMFWAYATSVAEVVVPTSSCEPYYLGNWKGHGGGPLHMIKARIHVEWLVGHSMLTSSHVCVSKWQNQSCIKLVL